MKIPRGFIEVTGIGTLRPIMIRVDLITSIGWMWRCSDSNQAAALIKKMQEEDASEVITPPEDALWWTVISTETGGTFNVVETVEEVTLRMCAAQEETEMKWRLGTWFSSIFSRSGTRTGAKS